MPTTLGSASDRPAPARRRTTRAASRAGWTRRTRCWPSGSAPGNLAYEERFGRIYLVRAKGRSGEDLLAFLEERLDNDPDTELEVTKGQLAEIALLRLTDLLTIETVTR